MSSVPNNTPGQAPITQEKLLEVIAKSKLSTTSNGCYGQICTMRVGNAPTGTIRALTSAEAFFTFNPLGKGLKGAWSIVPGTIDLIKEGALAVNDGVGATVYAGLNAATGNNISYESSGALGQSIQQEGVLATTGKFVHGVVTNLPGIGLINGLYRGNPEMIGSGVVGVLPLGAPLLRRGTAVAAGESAPRLPSGPTSSPRSQPPSTPIKSSGVAVGKKKRDPMREQELSKDPAHNGKISDKSKREADVGLSLEERGELKGPIQRDPNPAGGEFIDADGRVWDVKGFNSEFKNGFNLETAVDKIAKEAGKGEGVIIDTAKMSAEHIAHLRNALKPLNIGDSIKWFP